MLASCQYQRRRWTDSEALRQARTGFVIHPSLSEILRRKVIGAKLSFKNPVYCPVTCPSLESFLQHLFSSIMFQQHSPHILCLASARFVLSTHATALLPLTREDVPSQPERTGDHLNTTRCYCASPNWCDDHTCGYPYYFCNRYDSHLDRVLASEFTCRSYDEKCNPDSCQQSSSSLPHYNTNGQTNLEQPDMFLGGGRGEENSGQSCSELNGH